MVVTPHDCKLAMLDWEAHLSSEFEDIFCLGNGAFVDLVGNIAPRRFVVYGYVSHWYAMVSWQGQFC